MSLLEEMKKALYKQYFRRPSRLDTNLIDLMVNELIYLEKDFYAPVQKIKYVLPNNKMPSRIIKIAPPKRNHSTAVALSAIAAVAISFMILALSHSSQADHHRGFFWWIDKNSSGTSMLTSPSQSSYDDKNVQVNSYELSYSSDGIYIIGMAKNYNVSNRYRFCYKRTYNNVDIHVYYSSNLLFLWKYNGYDYYVIADKYSDVIRKIIMDYIDYIKDME